MQKVDGIFILDEVNSENVKERFQGFEGLIIYTNGSPNTVVVKESYYDNQEYKLTKILDTASVFEGLGTDRVQDVKNWVDMCIKENKKVFEGRIPEVAISAKAAKIIGIIWAFRLKKTKKSDRIVKENFIAILSLFWIKI